MSALTVKSYLRQLRELAAGRFARDSATLAVGILIGNGVSALVSPILTRLYSPADMGRFGLYTSFVGVASVATTFRYEFAIVAAASEDDASRIANGALLLAVPMSVLLGGILSALIFFDAFGFDGLPHWIGLFAPVALFLAAAFVVLRHCFIRGGKYPVVASSTIWQNGTRAASQLLLGGVNAGGASLIAGDLIGRLMAVVQMGRHSQGLIGGRQTLSWPSIRHTLAVYSEFPRISFPSALLNTAALNLPLPLIVHFFGAAAGGQFALVQLFFALPLSLIGGGIGDVFYSRVAAYARNNPAIIEQFFWRTTRALVLLGLPPLVLIGILAPSLSGLVFGDQWRTAGILAAYMIPWVLSQLAVSPVSRIVFVVRGQRLKLYYDATSLTLIALSLWLGSQLGWSLIGSVALLSCVQAVAYALYYLLMLYAIRRFVAADSSVQESATRATSSAVESHQGSYE